MATNKNITMKQFNGTDYDTLYPKTIASQIDDVYSKDEMSNLFLPKAGGSMGGILDMNGNRITNLAAPVADGDAVNKGYVDNKVPNVPPKTMYDGWTKIKTISVSPGEEKSFGTIPTTLSQVMLEVNSFRGRYCNWGVGNETGGAATVFNGRTKFIIANVCIYDNLVYGIVPNKFTFSGGAPYASIIPVDNIKSSDATCTLTLWYR